MRRARRCRPPHSPFASARPLSLRPAPSRRKANRNKRLQSSSLSYPRPDSAQLFNNRLPWSELAAVSALIGVEHPALLRGRWIAQHALLFGGPVIPAIFAKPSPRNRGAPEPDSRWVEFVSSNSAAFRTAQPISQPRKNEKEKQEPPH